VKYVIDLPFFAPSNVVALMNLDKFNALPEAARNQLITLSAEFEPKMVKHFDDEDEREWKEIGSSVTKVKFSPQENERYLKTAYEVEWAALQARTPELIQKLRSISGN
jgi:TRAP-type mannitol/chloroaromatic compound transport system substrate-binding protein